METNVLLNAWEYWCPHCKQLRLWLKSADKPTSCGNCHYKHILIEKAGEIDKELMVEPCRCKQHTRRT